MNKYLCRYCDKEMKIDEIDYLFTSYKCDCEEYLKEKQSQKEIEKLRKELLDKERELKNHISNSLYSHNIREFEGQIKKLKDTHQEFSNLESKGYYYL